MNNALIIDDVMDARFWMEEALKEAFPEVITEHAETLLEARDCINRSCYDLALIDLQLPDGNGVDLIKEIITDQPSTLCIVVTIYDDDQHLFPALQAGASGYLLKDLPHEALKQRLQGIVEGSPPLSPAIARRLLAHFNNPAQTTHNLTPRECEVLALIAKGITQSAVAEMLSISPHTVGDHIKNIYIKLNITSRAEATLEAARLGLITLG